MVTFNDILEKLKDILSTDIRDRKIYDKDVAQALKIPQNTFGTMKKRNSIPYEEVMEFCARRKISMNWFFFGQSTEMLQIKG